MGKMSPVQRGKEWGRCHVCREEENGEGATCAGRKKWGRCHVCREEENGEDATCAGRKKMGKMSRVQGGREWGRCHVCREEEPCTSEAQRKAKMENKY